MMRLEVRWETGTRYYEVWRGQDLLGDDMLETRWGGKYNRLGDSFKTKVTEKQAQAIIAEIAERRRKHKYERVH